MYDDITSTVSQKEFGRDEGGCLISYPLLYYYHRSDADADADADADIAWPRRLHTTRGSRPRQARPCFALRQHKRRSKVVNVIIKMKLLADDVG